MHERNNADYFRMRAEDERLRSQQATDPRAAGVHAEMALRYEEMANQFESQVKDSDRRLILPSRQSLTGQFVGHGRSHRVSFGRE